MPSSYPASWIQRVDVAPKLHLDVTANVYRSESADIAVAVEAVEDRTLSYLKAEAARKKKRLSVEDEALCRKFVLLVDNWDSANWRVGARNAEQRTARATGSTK